MNGLLFSLPGTPVLYYGDEIGMGDNVYLGDRNGVRTPMQWNAERNAGFSRGNPQRLFLPVNIDPEYHYQTVNVEAQQNNPHSLLWWMKHLIALRKQHAAFGRGTLEFLTADNRKVLAFLRSCPRPPTPDHDGSPSETARPAGGGNAAPDPSDERILVVANLSRFVQHAALDLSSFKGLVPVEMRGRSVLPPVGEGPYGITLSPFAFYWLELLPASEVARQRKHSGQALTVAGPPDPRSMAKLEIVGDWQNIFRSTTRAKLGAILLDYMREQPWFTGSGARPLLARVVENAPIPCGESSVNVLLVQVEYAEDEMQTFVVPLAFAFAAGAERILRVRPQAVVCRLRVVPENADAEGRDGILCDPLGEAGFSWSLLAALARRRRFRGNSGELTAWNADVLPRLHLFRRPRPEPALDKTLQRITMVTFGDRAVLKTFRSVEPGTHPEVEIGRALAEKTSFTAIAPVAGALVYRSDAGQQTTLGALLGFVPNEGNAWHYTLDALRRFFVQVLTRAPHGQPALPGRPFLDAAEHELPPIVPDLIGPYLESVRLMGQRTAELHIALASIGDNADFAPEPFTLSYQRSLYQTVRTRVSQVLDGLRERQADLPEKDREDAQRLQERKSDLLLHLRPILERRITAQRIRCHGDYRLDSLLFTGRDFVIGDFEGDVSRHLSNRRRKRSPLRDVASMLYSFYFAVGAGLYAGDLRPDDLPLLRPWARFWHVWVAVAFLKSYLESASSAGFLPTTRDELQVLLDFYLLSRGLGELRARLDGRLDLVDIPLQALLHILELRDHPAQ
jgi:maltose alpha-D-glucosyltransferase/alpha-amylase